MPDLIGFGRSDKPADMDDAYLCVSRRCHQPNREGARAARRHLLRPGLGRADRAAGRCREPGSVRASGDQQHRPRGGTCIGAGGLSRGQRLHPVEEDQPGHDRPRRHPDGRACLAKRRGPLHRRGIRRTLPRPELQGGRAHHGRSACRCSRATRQTPPTSGPGRSSGAGRNPS